MFCCKTVNLMSFRLNFHMNRQKNSKTLLHFEKSGKVVGKYSCILYKSVLMCRMDKRKKKFFTTQENQQQ